MDKVMVEELDPKHAALHASSRRRSTAPPPTKTFSTDWKEKLRLKDELAGHVTH